MKLFTLNSTEDLICRGYKQNEILELTGIDTGYHNNKYKTILKDIDRTTYKYEHIKQRFTNNEIQLILDYYYHGATKKETLNKLLIHDYEKLNLKKCFTYLGYQEQFEIANENNKRNYWQKGMIKKYDTDNPFKLNEFQEKALETRVKKHHINRHKQLEDYKNSEEYKSLSKQDKMKMTSLMRYGTPYPLQSQFVRDKIIKTNIEKYGVKTTLLDPHTNNKIKMTNLERYGVENPIVLKETKEKRKQTNIKKYGHINPLLNNNINQKARKTMNEKYGVNYTMQSKEMIEKAKATNLKRYGHKIALNAPEKKEKAIQTNLEKYGVSHFRQLPEQRKRQSDYMKTHQKEHIKAKKENKTFNSSSQENKILPVLKKLFPDVIEQHTSKEYPHACDFYIPSRNLYIELNISWTHNTHWFNPKSESDLQESSKWINSTKYYQNAHKTWTYYDVNKRNNAHKNKLNYLVFWQRDLSDFDLWIQMGCPDAKDWEREYSWLDITLLPKINQKHFIPLKNGSKTITKIARQFMYPVIYEREINMWNENVITNKGHIQPFLFANRLKYIGKLPHELSDLEIIRGFSISGKIRAYTAFDNTLMKQVIETYQPKSIFDPCAGWGERLLTAATYDIEYHGQDINDKLLKPYQEMIQTYNLNKQTITIIDSSQTKNTTDMLFTCPPYGNTEIYTDKGSENLSEDEFLNWWNRIIENSNVNIIAFQINQKWKNKMAEVVKSNGYKFIEELTSVTNASHLNKNKKEYESVMVFQKV